MMDAQRGGFKQGNISKCCLRKRNSHAGFAWEYFKN